MTVKTIHNVYINRSKQQMTNELQTIEGHKKSDKIKIYQKSPFWCKKGLKMVIFIRNAQIYPSKIKIYPL